MSYKIAIIGATGLVGQKILQVFTERQVPISELYLAASDASAGKEITYQSQSYTLQKVSEVLQARPQIALFSAGSGPSLEWAPKFAAAGCWVIDNSSAWRMYDTVALVVPEINAHTISLNHKIIANPNCSTIQMVMALYNAHRTHHIARIVVSTYQSVTGTGNRAVLQLMNERKGHYDGYKIYPHEIDLNVLPQVDIFLNDGYTKEEHKLIQETQKILECPELAITATAVRVPVMGGHSESVNVQFKSPISEVELRTIISNTTGCVVFDDPQQNQYPMPITAHENDTVWVGRIRKDPSALHAFNLWIVSDNLRKGAATNAVQIAEYLIQKKFLISN